MAGVPNVKVSDLAVANPERLGDRTVVWRWSHVRESAIIGSDVVIGEYVYVGAGVEIGNKVKIQNGAQVFEGSVIHDGAFIGPGVILTNDQFPRSINPDGSKKTTEDWELVGVTVESGASIGAAAVCIAPLIVGKWALVAAGSVVTKDVANFALVAGNPARFVRWVGRAGIPLIKQSDEIFVCPKTGEEYFLKAADKLVLR